MAILAILFLIIIIMVIKNASFHVAKTKEVSLPYVKKDYLLTVAERTFFAVLQKAIGDDYLLFSKVRISDLFYLPKMSNSNYYSYQNKIQSKHVDFLICDKENIRPLLAIELDDSSHARTDRISRDNFVDKIFTDANLPILHIRIAANYNSDQLLTQIQNSFGLHEKTSVTS